MESLIIAICAVAAIIAFIVGCCNTCDNAYRGMTKEEAEEVLLISQLQLEGIILGKLKPNVFINKPLLEKKIESLQEYIAEYNQETV
jgi:hypothetical protein